MRRNMATSRDGVRKCGESNRCDASGKGQFASEQNGEAGSLEMLVVGESLHDSETAQEGKGDEIDDAGRPCAASTIFDPGSIDFTHGGFQQPSIGEHALSQICHFSPISPPGSGIPALIKDQCGGKQGTARSHQAVKDGGGCRMPLIADVPDCDQSQGVEEYRRHGWCSSCRAAWSWWPLSK